MKRTIPDLIHLLIIAAILACLAIGSSVSVRAESHSSTQQQLEAALAGPWRMKEKSSAVIAGTEPCPGLYQALNLKFMMEANP